MTAALPPSNSEPPVPCIVSKKPTRTTNCATRTALGEQPPLRLGYRCDVGFHRPSADRPLPMQILSIGSAPLRLMLAVRLAAGRSLWIG